MVIWYSFVLQKAKLESQIAEVGQNCEDEKEEVRVDELLGCLILAAVCVLD